jgi:cytochrome c peroxidase
MPVMVLALAMTACGREMNRSASVADPAQLAAFGRLPALMAAPDEPTTAAKISLGRTLYYDVRLSLDHTVSCNTCHLLDTYGVDHRPTSLGVGGLTGSRNAPSVYNAAGHLSQFWDGRAPTVEEQAKGPILNPVEMAMPSSEAVIDRLRAIPEYRAAFIAAFPGELDPLTYDNVGRAIGAFERRLVTPSRWDAYLAGDVMALTPEERAGLEVFTAAGCSSCHRGTYVGGETYQRAGMVEPWPNAVDSGRYLVTRRRGDHFVYKVPSLRNIAETAPYFHDGQVATLDQAVSWMARYQLGRDLRPAEVTSIVTWLGSLTGPIPWDYIVPPEPAGRKAARAGP